MGSADTLHHVDKGHTSVSQASGRAFRDIRTHGPYNLRGMRDTDKVGQDDSIWMTIDINAYHEASALGDLSLTLLPSGRLVSSAGVENPDS